MKKVTLYIPCYNAEQYISDCLDGVLRQTYPIDEILIIDDASTDGTLNIVSRYPVRIIKHYVNKGLTVSRNTAFKEARNEFVASLDSDCVPTSEWLEKLMGCFADGIVAGAGGMLIEKYTKNMADQWRKAHMSQHWGDKCIECPSFLYGSNTVFRKSVIKSIDFYNEIFKNNGEDVDISQRIYQCGEKLVYISEALVDHLRRDTVRSVFETYWNWHAGRYYNKLHSDNCVFRKVAGYMAIQYETLENIFRKDLKIGHFLFLFMDFMLIFFFMKLDFKKIINKLCY